MQTSQLQELFGAGRDDEAWRRLLVDARAATDYPAVQALCRVRRKLIARGPSPEQPSRIRLALLGGVSTVLLEEPLMLALESIGVACTMHVSSYDTFAREMLDARSDTVAFRPDVAVVVVTTASFPEWPSWQATVEEVDAAIDRACEHWDGLCRALHAHAGCDIVLPTFHPPIVRPLGAAATRRPGEESRFILGVNEALARRLPAYVHLHDVASLASRYGIEDWFDVRYWYHARQPVSFACLVPYVHSLAHLVGSLFGRSARCVVVDLDNTLWGGVVGDDGPDHVVVGEGDPLGEAFVAFQRYLVRLRERGVMLAVASKNDESMALAPFSTRREMLLRAGDFVSFHANWRPKIENIREIADELHIGLDAIVFVDDDAGEREQVRRALPDVRVVELGADPAFYPMQLDRTGWLETSMLSDEDHTRSRMYVANTGREQLKSAMDDYDGYLAALDQRAVVVPFRERDLDRIHQLTNKTNQFNLTTRRMSRGELAAMIDASDRLTACVRLVDRFGDNGLISVVAARGDGPDLWIDLWLMSCRVLQRGVERLLFNHVVEQAKRSGYRTLHGIHVPTARNGMVREHYASLGFRPCGSLDGGDHWLLDLADAVELPTWITVVDDLHSHTEDAHHG